MFKYLFLSFFLLVGIQAEDKKAKITKESHLGPVSALAFRYFIKRKDLNLTIFAKSPSQELVVTEISSQCLAHERNRLDILGFVRLL